MGRWRKNSKELKIKNLLLNRFHQQERITKQTALDDYMNPHGKFQAIMAKDLIGKIFESIRKELDEEGIVFGCITPDLEWGIPTSKEDFDFHLKEGYKQGKGRNISAWKWVNAAKRRGFLQKMEEERISLPKILNGEQKELK